MPEVKPIPTRKAPTTKGQPIPTFHPDDWNGLQALRRELVGWHYTGDLNTAELGEKVGRGMSFLSYMERGDFQGPLSHFQLWAQAFDLRLDFQLHGLVEPEPTAELKMMEALAQPCNSHGWQRQLLNLRLILCREHLGLSYEQVAQTVGLSPRAVRESEGRNADYLLPRLFSRVRGLGGELRLYLSPCQ